jgi:arylsulfatase A-like enzyme
MNVTKLRCALFLATLIGSAVGVWSPAQSQDLPRPNIVILLTDDQRWDAIGFVQRQLPGGRFPFLSQSTPNIDSIAAAGVWFDNAFVADSLCSPSRAAFLTGKYNHINGIVNNSTGFPVNTQTFATLLRAAGYHTGFFGKWHMGNQRERPGFDEYASFVGQGQYFNCPLIVNGVDTPTVGWVDDVTTTYALNFIASSANQPQPFLMVLGFKTSHSPNTPPTPTSGLFSTITIDTPPNATSYPPYFVNPGPSTFGGNGFRNYFRTIVGMDQNVGRVLNALDSVGIAEDTIVVFASDNGLHMREHGSPSPVQTDGEKRSAYEASIRIPLIVRYPRMVGAGRTIDAEVMNIDLAPTLLQLAGLQPDAGMQGTSWVPLLNGTATSVRNGIFYEYFREAGFIVPRIMAFRLDGMKLIQYPDHPEYGSEFYDLTVDPWETNNRIADPTVSTQVAAMSQAMASAAASLGYRIPPGANPQF